MSCALRIPSTQLQDPTCDASITQQRGSRPSILEIGSARVLRQTPPTCSSNRLLFFRLLRSAHTNTNFFTLNERSYRHFDSSSESKLELALIAIVVCMFKSEALQLTNHACAAAASSSSNSAGCLLREALSWLSGVGWMPRRWSRGAATEDGRGCTCAWCLADGGGGPTHLQASPCPNWNSKECRAVSMSVRPARDREEPMVSRPRTRCQTHRCRMSSASRRRLRGHHFAAAAALWPTHSRRLRVGEPGTRRAGCRCVGVTVGVRGASGRSRSSGPAWP